MQPVRQSVYQPHSVLYAPDTSTTMGKKLHKPLLVSVRVGCANRSHRWAVATALLCLAALCLVLDFSQFAGGGDSIPPEQEEFVDTRLEQLDDPVGFKSYFLQQQGHSSMEAVARKKHRDAQQTLAAQLKQPGVICENTCFKANDGVCDEGRRGNLTVNDGSNFVACDLGTDCQDCGPWQGVQHGPAWDAGMGPIAYLRANQIEVRVKQVPFSPNFIFAFTDPKIDTDQSEHMRANGVVEPGIAQVFYKVLSKRCRRDAPGTQGFVVDVGGNYGWFALLSAALGCSVLSIEPVPIFRAFMEYSAARNHLTPLIELLPAVVALNTTMTYTINVPLFAGAQWGASGMDVAVHPGTKQVPARAVHLDGLAYPNTKRMGLRALTNLFDSSSSSSSSSRSLRGSISVTSSSSSSSSSSSEDVDAAVPPADTNAAAAAAPQATTAANSSSSSSSKGSRRRQPPLASRLLPAKLSERIDILKVDVEGREPDVFATAARLLESGKVDNIIMEYSPGYYYQVTDRLADMPLLPSLLLDILRHNYSMVHIPWGIAHNSYPMKAAGNTWDTALPPMDAITAPQLAYDLWTAEHIRNGTLPGMHGPTSWPCPEMSKAGMSISEPGYERYGMHIAFHPKAFMANFVFNTNVWASKDKSLQVAGTGLFNNRELFPFYYPSTSRWFPQSATSDTHEWGLPWAHCPDVPPKFQVAHRCRCRAWDVCGEQQVAVQQCVDKKTTGYDNLPDELSRAAMDRAAAIMAGRAAQATK